MNQINRRAVLSASVTAISALALPRASRAQSGPETPRPAVAVYAATPVVDHIALSPDGKRVAVITQKGDEKILMYFAPSDKDTRATSLGTAKIRGLFWGSNSHVIITQSTTTDLRRFAGGRSEFLLGRSLELETMELRTFFAREREFYQIVFGGMQRIKVDGKFRVTAANQYLPAPRNTVLFSFSPQSARGIPLIVGNPNTYDFVITPEGAPVAQVDFDDDHKQWELHYNTGLAKGRVQFKRVLSQKGEATDLPDLIGLGRDGATVVIRTSDDEYKEVSANGTLSASLEPKDSDLPHSALMHPTTARLAGFARHDDWPTNLWFDPLMKKLEDAQQQMLGEGVRYSAVSYAEDPRKMIIYTESATDAGTYVLCDFVTGDISDIAINYEAIPEEWITEKQALSYKAADGLEIHGYLTLPPFRDAKNLPLIVLPHGGPRSRDFIGFDWQSQCLAAHGYAVLQPNFRGSSGYGRDFVDAGNGEWGRKMQTDLSDGVRYLAGRGVIDPARVAILGASYGGYAALAGATLDQGVYRCAVSIAGVSDLKAMLDYERGFANSSDASNLLHWRRLMGDPKTYDAISPARQAARAYCPILLVHGLDDTVVPVDQSRRMEKALKSAGKPVESITYKGQDHWETQGSSRIAMMEAVLAFLSRHNPAE